MDKTLRKIFGLLVIVEVVLWGFIVAECWDIVLAFACGAAFFGVLLVLPVDNS